MKIWVVTILFIHVSKGCNIASLQSWCCTGTLRGFFQDGFPFENSNDPLPWPPGHRPSPHKKNHITICTDARGMALRHSVVIESRNAVKTCFCLHNFWKDLGTNKFLAISGRVPGTPCWNLTGSQEPVEPVLVRSLSYIYSNNNHWCILISDFNL